MVKELEQNVRGRSRNGKVSFEFKVESSVLPQPIVFTLPDASGNWSKTFTDMPWGIYTLTEKANGLYTTTYKIDNGEYTSGPAIFELSDFAKTLNRTITVKNKQNEPNVVQATKTWLEGSTQQDIYLSLYRQDPDNNSTILINTAKLISGAASISWSQLDYADLLRYKAENGKAYIYYVVETDSSGTPTAPSGHFKIENGLNVINGPIPPVQINGSKSLTGRALADQEFTFEFYLSDQAGSQGRLLGSCKNSGGSFAITLSHIDRLGTSYVLIKEKNENLGGIAYDPALYLLKVETAYNSTLKKAEQTKTLYKKNGGVWQRVASGVAAFNNSYTSTGTYTPTAFKVLTGRPLAQDDFTFALYEVTEAGTQQISTAKNKADGHVTFPAVVLNKAGTYHYQIKEVIPSNGNRVKGMTYSNAVYDVTVTAAENNPPNGQLAVTTLIKKGETVVNEASFSNTYAPTASIKPTFRKTAENFTLKPGDFSFIMSSEDHPNFAERSAVNDRNGQVVFSDISYTLADAGKTYTYKIKEKIPTDPLDYIIYDEHETTLKVTVTDNYPNGLKTEAVYDNENDGWIFVNKYNPKGFWQPKANKLLDGYNESFAGKFTFELRKGSQTAPVLESKTTAADGSVTFSKIEYGAADVGQHYVYFITEKPGDIPGIQYSSEVKTIHVWIKDSGEGVLTPYFDQNMTVSEQPEATITNTYFAAGKWTPVVRKKIDGRAFVPSDQFTFGLWETNSDFAVSGDPLQTAVTNNGSIPFEAIDYSTTNPVENKTYYYVIKEIIPENPLGNMTYDQAEIHVTVKVTTGGDTGMTVKPTYVFAFPGEPTGQPAQTFVNKYQAEIKWQPKVKKVLQGRPLKADEFEFKMTAQAPGQSLSSESVTNNASGLAVFSEITYTQKDLGKEFTYTFIEVDPDNHEPSMAYDTASYTVKVKVTYDVQSGGLKLTYITASEGGSVSSAEAPEFTFNNVYTATGTWLPEVNKKLTGRAMTAGEFTFEIYKVVGGERTKIEGITGTNPAAQSGSPVRIVFNEKLSFNQADIGNTYQYEVQEAVPAEDPEWMSYDRTPVRISLTVGDAGNGKLAFTAVYEDGRQLFENTYKAKGSWFPPAAVKTLNGGGREAAAGEFSFELKQTYPPTAAKPQVVQNDAEGKAVFNAISYTQADLGKTFTYTMKELVPADPENSMGYDDTVYTFTIKLVDDKAGHLVPTVEIDPALPNGTAQFSNTYHASGQWQIQALKTLNGRSLKPGEFSFTLSKDGDENFPVQTKQNNAAGGVSFDTLSFNEKDIGKTYTYTVQEVIPAEADREGGMTYDDHVWKVALTIADGKNGSLNIQAAYTRNQESITPDDGILTFENSYKASGSLVITAKKQLKGRVLEASEFGFLLQDSNGRTIERVVNDGEGKITFSAIPYTEADIGQTYLYKVKEDIPAEAEREGGMTYSQEENLISVKITDAGNGKLTVKANYLQDKTFVNTYIARGSWTPEVSKTLDGRALKAGEFSFELLKGNESLETVTNKADGKVPFKAIRYSEADIGKTYDYSIRELIPKVTEAGLVYDSRIVNVKVSISDLGGGRLDVRAVYNENGSEAVFENVYKADGSWTPAASKILSGRALKNEEFNFVLMQGEEVLQTVKNQADGKIPFAPVAYTQADIGKNLTYRIAEVEPATPEIGMSYEGKEIFVTVSVEDDGNGKLKVTAEYSEPALFENRYEAEGSWTPEVSKVLAAGGRTLEAGEFSFELLKGKESLETVTNQADGKVIFTTINYTEKDIGQTYQYTVKELIPAYPEAGMTYSEEEIVITVAVTDAGNGKLNVQVTYPDDKTFDNSYKAEGSWTPEVFKALDSRALRAEEFSFQLLKGKELLETVTNQADGKVTFKAIRYSEADIGQTYTYTVKEVIPAEADREGGMTYSEEEIVIKVRVTDAGNGRLNVAVTYPDDKTFDNRYEAKGSWQPQVEKILKGRALRADEFTFVLSDEKSELQQAKNQADGSVVFKPIAFSEKDINKSYTYTIRELKPLVSENGMSYDSKIVKVTLKVTDGGQGRLVITADYGEGADKAVFENRYQADGSWTPAVSKRLEGRALKAGEFEFILKEAGSKDELQRVRNQADGSVPFTALVYKAEDIGKTYHYEITEAVPAAAETGMSYDTKTVAVEVKVEDAGGGSLKLTALYSEEALFENHYKAEGSFTFEAEKVLQGRALKDGEFRFELMKGDELIAYAVNDKDGRIIFPALKFTEDDIGKTYRFTLSECKPLTAENGMRYDPAVYQINLTVGDAGNGKLSFTSDYETKAVFENRYEAEGIWQPEFTKVLEGREIKNAEFTFILEKDGKEAGRSENNSSGRIVFPPQVFTQDDIGKTYTYKVREALPKEAENGMQYDESLLVLKAKIDDLGGGVLKVTVTAEDGKLQFNNVYTAEGSWKPEVTKELRGLALKEGAFKFVLSENGRVLQEVRNKADGTIPFEAVTYTQADIGKTFVYELAEVKPDKPDEKMDYDERVMTYEVTVEDLGGGRLGIQVKGSEKEAKFVNTYHPAEGSLTVKKIWKGTNKRPTIEVQLYRNGVAFGDKVELKGVTEYTWKNVRLEDEKGRPYKFTVQEVKVPEGFKVSYGEDGLTIINEYAEVPETGEKLGSAAASAMALLASAVLAYVVKRELEKRGGEKRKH